MAHAGPRTHRHHRPVGAGSGQQFLRVDRELSREDSLGNAYLAQPSGDLRRGLQETSRSLAAVLDYLVVQGESDDAAAAHQIKARHAQAGRDLERMLAAWTLATSPWPRRSMTERRRASMTASTSQPARTSIHGAASGGLLDG